MDYLTGYIIKLRKFMKKYPHKPPRENVTDGCEDEENTLPDVNPVYGKWNSLSTNVSTQMCNRLTWDIF